MVAWVPLSVLAADDTTRILDLERKLEALERRYKILEGKLETQGETQVGKEKLAPLVVAGKDGFAMQSQDGDFKLALKGLIQVDSRTYIDDGGINANDTLLLRRLRPIFEGTLFGNLDFKFIPEFGGTGGPIILDANLTYRYRPELQLTAGRFKVPVGLEQLQSDSTMFFAERALPTNLTPNRDIGVQLHGSLWENALLYAAGVFNGVGDNRNTTNADFDDEKEAAGRLFAHPFIKTDIKPLKGFGLGVGGSYGNQEGAAGLPVSSSVNGYLTDGQQTFFSYRTGVGTNASTANVIADGDHWRFAPQAYWYYSRFGLLGEYVISSQRLRRTAGAGTAGRTFGTIDNHAWQAAGSVVLTGEDASFNGVKPKNNFDPRNGGWGAFEAVGRFAELEIDDGAFPLFTTAGSASRATSFGGGLNWYWNRNVRLSFDYNHTEFSGGNGSNPVVRNGEDVVVTRFQLGF